jgi:hypothetical protein
MPPETPVDLRKVGIIVGSLALFAPIVLYIHRFDIAIFAMTWYYSTQYGLNAIYPLNMWFLLFITPRVLFVFQTIRYYKGKGSRRTSIALGIFGEVLFYLGGTAFSPVLIIPVPTPFMLISAIALMWFRPYVSSGKM